MGKEWAWLQTEQMLKRWESLLRGRGLPRELEVVSVSGGPVPQRPRGSSFAEVSGLAAEVGGRPVEPQVELTLDNASSAKPGLGNSFL